MSLLRVPLVFLSTASMQIALMNPSAPISAAESQKFAEGAGATQPSKVPLWWPPLLKSTLWIGCICESAVILSSHLPNTPLTDRILSTLVVGPTSSAANIRVTLIGLSGLFLSMFGSFIRYQCFRALGQLFTFHLSLRKDHKLITSGPYSIIRHPSYSFGILCDIGTTMCLFAPGSWLRECGILETQVGWLVIGINAALKASVVIHTLIRVKAEDHALKKEFGQRWDDWAKRVPYRLVPFIY